jgi:hypothetical protein
MADRCECDYVQGWEIMSGKTTAMSVNMLWDGENMSGETTAVYVN